MRIRVSLRPSSLLAASSSFRLDSQALPLDVGQGRSAAQGRDVQQGFDVQQGLNVPLPLDVEQRRDVAQGCEAAPAQTLRATLAGRSPVKPLVNSLLGD
jgi:hypothetical protein